MKNEIILLTKRDSFSARATEIAKSLFGPRLTYFPGNVGDPMPRLLETARPRLLISFLSPWIVPARVLDRAETSINVHPGSVDYPGTGCYNFAIYDGAREFGATCHHMLPKVDTGSVVEERRFPMFYSDTVETLKLRTMVTMVSMFHDIVCGIVLNRPLPVSTAHWTRKAYTRREMNALKRLTDDMSEAEIDRRIRATIYPGYDGPFFDRPEGRVPLHTPQRVAIA